MVFCLCIYAKFEKLNYCTLYKLNYRKSTYTYWVNCGVCMFTFTLLILNYLFPSTALVRILFNKGLMKIYQGLKTLIFFFDSFLLIAKS